MLEKNDPRRAQEYFDDKMAFTTGPVELSTALAQPNVHVVDVRAAKDFDEAHIPGSTNLPKDRWDAMTGLDRDKLIVVCCYSQVCHLAAAAAQKLARLGFSVMELEGGFKAWKEHKLAIERTSSMHRDPRASAPH